MIEFFTDRSCPSLRGFCRSHDIMNLYSTMNQFISKTPRLRHILKFDRRIESDLQQDALELIQRRYPAPEFGGEGEPSVGDGNVVVQGQIEVQ